MKKQVLCIAALCICLNAVSQTGSRVPLSNPAPAKKWVAPLTGEEIPLKNLNQATVRVHSNYNSKVTAPVMPPVSIMTTTYDLQSNAASCNRIYSKNVGVAGTCTWSQSGDLASLDRGTGYNFTTGTCCAWGPAPTTRVGTDRRGWPEIDYSEVGGFECFVAHNGAVPAVPGTHGIKLSKRSPAGSGIWIETQLPPADDDSSIIFLWPRLRIGGSNGITIHEIDLALPTASGGVVYHGMDGALTYSRSQDGGTTWDIRHMILPNEDSTLFSGMTADAYSIDAYGDVVAITYGSFTSDWCMWKSTDNGTTWTKTVIRQYAIEGFNSTVIGNSTDTNADTTPDTLMCTDGYNAILIDNNGVVHCWSDDMAMYDDGTANTFNYLSGTNGILYWNESMGATPATLPVVGYMQDMDNNQTLDLLAGTPGTYQSGLATMPTAGIDANGVIYLAYVTPIENTTNGIDQQFWQIFLKSSPDGGNSWTPDTNIINDAFTEAIFPSMARNVGACIPILWQQDGEPGLAVRGDMDPFNSNDIMYNCYDHIPPLSVQNIAAPASLASVTPNPASDFVNLNYTLKLSGLVKINISNVLGQPVYQSEIKMKSGKNSITVNLKNFHPGVYFVNTSMGETTYTSKFVVE